MTKRLNRKKIQLPDTVPTASNFVDLQPNYVVVARRGLTAPKSAKKRTGPKGDGQRHINWCRRQECGEEGVDWEVVPIQNKGLGIRAKKSLPAGMKIIVEPVFSSPNAHSGLFRIYIS